MVVVNKRRLCNKIFIITIKPVFANPGSIFFLTIDVLVMGEHIMQHLLRCNAESKNT